MTGICAIYSSFAQSRQPILSLTSTAIRGTTQIHVRRNSILACARDKSIVSPVHNRAVSSIFNVNQFGSSLQSVSEKISIEIQSKIIARNSEKILRKLWSVLHMCKK